MTDLSRTDRGASGLPADGSAPAAVTCRDVSASWGSIPALRDVNLSLPAGTLVAIVGPNGAGKSTLLKLLAGQITPDSGEIRLGGHAPDRAGPVRSWVPQRAQVDWDFPITVRELVAHGRWVRKRWWHRWTPDDQRRVDEALHATDLTALGQRRLDELSGGQQQRAFLARALVADGDVFLLDEPFAGVDAVTTATIRDVLRALRDRGRTCVVVHHELESVASLFDRVVLLNQRVIAAGPVAEVFHDANLRATFGTPPAPFAPGAREPERAPQTGARAPR